MVVGAVETRNSGMLCLKLINILKSPGMRIFPVRGFTLTFLQARVLESYLSFTYDTKKKIRYLSENIKE